MNIDKINNVYLIGIGGIGMSALARYFLEIGKNVAGYDKTPSPITESLISEGIIITFNDQIETFPKFIFANPDSTLVIYTPAIPNDSLQLEYCISNGLSIHKRSVILGEITKNKFTIAVGGTHGKTSTAWMIAHLLKSLGIDCFALLGGISLNYKSNYLSPKNKSSNIFVVEADEFDRSFLHLHPNVAIITSRDPDHLDIYGSANSLNDTYQEFANKIKINGKLVYNGIFKFDKSLFYKQISYGISDSEDVRAVNIRIENGSYIFDIAIQNRIIADVKLNIAGRHNILNTLAALAAASDLTGLEPEKIKNAISSFKGVQRRFEYIIKTDQQVLVDDYAHHPTELSATIRTMKELYPDKKILGVFQPHLFTRTRDFAEGFAASLSELDKVVLLDIYPARELPIKGIDSQMLLNLISIKEKHLVSKENLPEFIRKENTGVVLMLGAGDIDRLVEPVKNALLI